ncbi:MAG: signal peptidase II [Planctomycetota bacterium]
MADAAPHAAGSEANPERPAKAQAAAGSDDASLRPGRRSLLLLLVVTVLGLVTDLASKQIMFATLADDPVEVRRVEVMEATPELARLLPPHEPTVVVPSLLEFKLVLNPGALFGIGAGKRVFFIVSTALAIAFALWVFARLTTRRHWAAHAAIGLVISGGLGNVYDRIRFACVRDFIHPLPGVEFPFGISTPWSGTEVWPYVSNLADLWLIIGVCVLVVHLWRAPKPEDAQRGDAKSDAPGASGDAG